MVKDLDITIKVLHKVARIRRLENGLAKLDLDPELFQARRTFLRDGVERIYARYASILRSPEEAYLRRLIHEYGISLPVHREILDTTIDSLDLSTRTYNNLKRVGIEYIGELVTFDESDIIKIYNMGRVSVKELQDKLAEQGLFFGMDFIDYNPPTKIQSTFSQ